MMKSFWYLMKILMLVVITIICVTAIFSGASSDSALVTIFFWVLVVYADIQILREELKGTGAIN